jgi:hypothetical protein
MFAQGLHLVLALPALAAMLVVTGEAAVSTVSGRPPGKLASAGSNVLLVLLMTAAGGLALLVAGHRPNQSLHLMYAVVAFGLTPLAGSLTARAPPRVQALARLFGAAIALVAMVRLFQTG